MNKLSQMLYAIGERVHKLENKDMPTTVKINNGGTGATTAPAARHNLFEGAALPLSEGGTGATGAANARKNILENKPLSVAEGGTGATVVPGISGVTCSISELTLPKTVGDNPPASGELKLWAGSAFGNELLRGHPLAAEGIQRNDWKSNIDELWPKEKTALVHVEFCFYFTTGFNAGERIVMHLRSGDDVVARWNYYVKAAKPYAMYSGSAWVRMGSDSELKFRLSCTSGTGIVSGSVSNIVATTWDNLI